MLKTLSVWNFALIEHVRVDFAEGLNILTGETGAGKSILIEALGIVLGRRASITAIRTGCEQLRVEAVFLLTPTDKARAILAELNIAPIDNAVTVCRKISRASKSAVTVNGARITLAALKKLGNALVDVHGQNDNLALLRDDAIYNLVDASANAQAALERYRNVYRDWQSKKKALETMKLAAQQNDQRLDMLRWQEREISEAELKPDEDRQLETDIRRLANVEKIAQHIEEARQLLSGEEFDVMSALARAQKHLDDVSRVDPALEDTSKMMSDASILLQEVFDAICSYADRLEFAPERLDQLQERLDVVNRMKKKYGPGLEDVTARLSKIRAELDAIENFDADCSSLEKSIAELESQSKRSAAILSEARRSNAAAISTAVENELEQLFTEKVKFEVTVEATGRLTERGADAIDMMFSANAGVKPKPLSKIISGGELSRVALALKASGAGRDESPSSMIFDEIDTGIGGVTAGAVAECISKVSRSRQVLCITHLPQIACMADVHVSIEKNSDGARTLTTVKRLDEESRVREIARMASGDESPQSIENARAMLSGAASKKFLMKV